MEVQVLLGVPAPPHRPDAPALGVDDAGPARMSIASDTPVEAAVARAMELALDQARQADAEGEVPVGAAILGPDGAVLAMAHNEIESLQDPTAHAERLALSRACEGSGFARLPEGSLLAVTLEPCAMCAGALVWARVQQLIFGARDEKAGAVCSKVSLLSEGLFNHDIQVVEGVLANRCREILQQFFSQRRQPG